MNQSLSRFAPGSPELVVAHAAHRRSRGRRPSMRFRNERNPAAALKHTQHVLDWKMIRAELDRRAAEQIEIDEFWGPATGTRDPVTMFLPPRPRRDERGRFLKKDR